MSTAKRVSIIPPPPASGSFKIEKTDRGDIVATPVKDGRKLTIQPSHAYDQNGGSWTPIFGTSPIGLPNSPISKLSTPRPSPTATPVPPIPAAGTLGPVSSSDSSKIKSTTHTSTPPPVASPTTPPNSSPDTNKMEQLVQALINHGKSSLSDHSTDGNIATPRYNNKRGRDLCDKASLGLPLASRYDLKQKGALQFLRLLQRTSNSYYWGTVLNGIPTANGPKSLMHNTREMTLADVTNEAARCWGSHDAACTTTDPAIIQERTIRMMIGNWAMNALLDKGLDRLELKRDLFSYHRPE